MTNPLYELLCKTYTDKYMEKTKGQKPSSEKIKWTPNYELTVHNLIEYLKSPEKLTYPDFGKGFIFHCDAYEEGFGFGILLLYTTVLSTKSLDFHYFICCLVTTVSCQSITCLILLTIKKNRLIVIQSL